MDVAKFSSALSTLWLYSITNVRAQDHPHPIAGRALPPSRWRRIASRKCEEPFRGDMNLVSSGSTLRGRFSGYSLVRLSQTAVVAVLHYQPASCKNLHDEDKQQSTFDSPGPFGPPREAWGTDRRGAGGNGHRPRWSANHADRWRGVPDWRTAVGNASGGRDGGVDGPPVARGASGGWRSERGKNQWCADV